MSEPKGKIVHQTGIPREKELDFWEPVIFTKEDIDNEIKRLADLDQPENGFRSSILAHPRAEESSLGLAPGIRVSLDVLRPGEQSRLFRHNATEVNFCIKGSGFTEIAGKKIKYGQYHVVNHPSYTAYRHVNDTDKVQARLTYSNIPLLQRLNVYTANENPPVMAAVEEDRGEEKGQIFNLTRIRICINNIFEGYTLFLHNINIDCPFVFCRTKGHTTILNGYFPFFLVFFFSISIN